MTHWTDDLLETLPSKGAFRLRGTHMTRLETFTDAAFAFGVTLLVISVDDVPRSFAEFLQALKLIPAFLACFVQLMLFWWAHHVWSRRFGLDDGRTLFLSLFLVATVLVFIFPLRVIFTGFFASLSNGWLPSPFPLTLAQIGSLFAVFGAGFFLMALTIALLYAHALSQSATLRLSALERYETRSEIFIWTLIALTAAVSVGVALIAPPEHSPAAGYLFWTLMFTAPGLSAWLNRRRRAQFPEPLP